MHETSRSSHSTARPSAWALLPLLACVTACAKASSGPPDILLISVDTLRADHLGCYGYPRDTSPHLDGLAEQSRVFDRMVSTASWTLPAHTSMLTGLYPAFHGLQDDGNKLVAGVESIAQALGPAEYTSIAVVSHVYVSSQFGLERGFDVFDDSLIDGGARNPIAAEVVDRFAEHLRGVSAERLFAFVHFFDPHWDYTPPEPYDRRFTDPAYEGSVDGTMASLERFFEARARMPAADLQHTLDLYDGEIAYLDAQLDRLIGLLREARGDRPLAILVTADHGEEFKEHGRLGHGKTLFGEQLAVPLIVHAPGRLAPGRSDRLVSTIDLAPTVLDLAGMQASPRHQGRSVLAPEAEGDLGRVVFSESIRFGNELRTAQRGDHKVLHVLQGDRKLYYDLAADPAEQRPARQDPSGGALLDALNQHAAFADQGWHLKLVASSNDAMRVQATLETSGRFVRPRRYYSVFHVSSAGTLEFPEFELSEDGSRLTFDATLQRKLCEITFQTEPADAPVRFEVSLTTHAELAGVYLGTGDPLPDGSTFELDPGDRRLKGMPTNYWAAWPGLYLRTVQPPAVDRSSLSDAALDHLRALGYLDEE